MKRKPWLIGSGALLVMACVAMGWLWWAMQRGQTVAKLERSIEKEVPPGCDRKTVELWFDRHQIEHGWYEDTTVAMLGHQTMPQLVGLRSEDLIGMQAGGIDEGEVNVDLMFTGRIDIYFFFDKQGRRVGHLVSPFVYMP